jgi:hypothetical protein
MPITVNMNGFYRNNLHPIAKFVEPFKITQQKMQNRKNRNILLILPLKEVYRNRNIYNL